MNNFWLCFVPLFFAVDAIGVLPMFINFTEGLERKTVRKVIIESIITAMIVAVTFLFAGRAIFAYLGIRISDFMVAGGVLLFVFSVRDIVSVNKVHRSDKDSFGAVPIGVPLIAGPAVLTTSIILVGQYDYIFVLITLCLNIVITGVLFWFSNGIYRVLGRAGSKAISKIASLFLAAIATMMIRKGVFDIIQLFNSTK
jgi:multiple antibiotic resistance protein